jgi:hypothetical protein
VQEREGKKIGGAELFDFLVFRKYFGQKMVAKNERMRCLYKFYCISLFEVKILLYINVRC